MSLEKHPKADLEKKRSLLFLIGIVAALLITIIALEWDFSEKEKELAEYTLEGEEEEIIPITRITEPPPPPVKKPPPPPPPPTNFEEDEEAKDDDTDFNSEDEEDEEQEDYEQDEESAPVSKIFMVVEQMPAFKGCETKSKNELRTCNYIKTTQFFNDNQSYPYLERENGIEGTVYISFVIDENGKPDDIKVLKSVSAGLDKEAIRLIKSMPKWIPGKQRGTPVKVSQTIPMRFSLK